MSERPAHLQHPATSGHTLCGVTAGDGCLWVKPGEAVTCEACRAVVNWCRSVHLGRAPREAGA